MVTGKVARNIAFGYLLLAGAAVVYELSIRLFDRGNSEFAGMVSVALTLPMSLVLIGLSKAVIGVNVGDSDAAFVAILGLSALTNACILWVVVRALSRWQ
jgi:hypothetical protein